MNIIKFSHVYKKMPSGVTLLETWIKDVAIINFSQLTPQEIEQDTAIIGGGNYELPKGKLIWIKLYTDSLPKPTEWATLRRYTPEKFEYYSKLVGQQVKIVIDETRQNRRINEA